MKEKKSNILELLTSENWDDNGRGKVRLLDRTKAQLCGHEVQQQLAIMTATMQSGVPE